MSKLKRRGTAATKPAAKPVVDQTQRSVTSESVSIDLGAVDTTSTRPPKVPPSPMFFLVHKPGAYHVQGGQVLPRLVKWKLQPGVNGIGADPHGRPVFRSALDEIRNTGATVLPHTIHGGSYLIKPKGTDAHLTRWEQVFPGSSSIRADEDGYTQWIAELVELGHLPKPALHVLEEMAEKLAKVLDAQGDGRLSDRLRPRVQGDLDAVEAEIAKLQDHREPVSTEAVEVDA